MSTYLKYFKIRLIVNLQYRTAAIAGLATQFFWGIINVLVYVIFYSNTTNNVGINLTETITYVWLFQSLYALVFIRYKDNELNSQIKEGTIAYELVRPYNSYVWWFVKTIAQRYSGCLLRCFPILLIAFILPEPYNLSLPVSVLSFIIFLITLILGSILLTSILMLIHIYAFFSYNSDGIMNVLGIIIEVLAGFAIPIPILPSIIQKINLFLPFRFISDLSFRIYAGNIPIEEGITSIVFQIIWIIFLIIIGSFLMKKALKNLSIQGG